MKVHERAAQIWSVLALAARNRQVLTYDIVGRLVGVPRHGLGRLLEPIQSYCLLQSLPPLKILVVSGETGLPSTGFIATQDIPKNQLNVFSHDWLAQGAPSPEDFAEAVARNPSNGDPEAVTRARS